MRARTDRRGRISLVWKPFFTPLDFFLRRHRNFLHWPSPFDGPAVCGLTVTGGGEAVLCSVSVAPLVVRNPVWIGHY